MSDDFSLFKERTSSKSTPVKPKKQSNSVETPKSPASRPATPYINRSDLKNELRQLIDTVGSGHKKYTLLGYENILQVKARIWKIIDLL